jgi:hypothetical protein
LVEKPEGKRPLGKPTSKWENNIKTDLREKEWGRMHWSNLAQNRGQGWALMNTFGFHKMLGNS